MSMSEPVDTPHAAVLWMIFGSLCFGTMNALVKYTSGLDGVDVWMVILIRSAVIAFAVAGFAVSRGISLKMNDPKTMFLRCAVGLTAMILYFSALGSRASLECGRLRRGGTWWLGGWCSGGW